AFSVSGANSAAGRVKSLRTGQAIFSYVGTNSGADVITVTLASLRRSITNTWLNADESALPVISMQNVQPLQFGLAAQLPATVTVGGQPASTGLHAQWRFLDGPASAAFDDPSQIAGRAVCSASGTYRFQLT